jgi:hypothetical protein
MRFLEDGEVELWCAEHRLTLTENEARLAPDPRLAHSARMVYATGTPSGREPAVAASARASLRAWDECLLWITLTGVWPSTENWPAFYALRGEENERRALYIAPGHVFDASEGAKLQRFLSVVMECAWDAWVLPSQQNRPMEGRLRVSHDEWLELQSQRPEAFAV